MQHAQACPILAHGAQIEVRPVAGFVPSDGRGERGLRFLRDALIETPQIVQTTAKATAFIHLTVPREEMPNVFGPAIGELTAALSAQGIAPAGPIFAHHPKIAPDIFDFEVSVPVSAPISAAGRVTPGEWPSMRVARTVYHGPYEGLHHAWESFMEWIEANGHQPAEDVWECYLTGPESSPDPANWRTQLNRPLIA